jgi:hypothetical protein
LACEAAEYGVRIPDVHSFLHAAPDYPERDRSRYGLWSTSEQRIRTGAAVYDWYVKRLERCIPFFELDLDTVLRYFNRSE